jgi:hypothetical protein
MMFDPRTIRVALLTVVMVVATAGIASAQQSTVTLPFSVYGYIKLDAAYDSAPTSSGNYARWAEPGNSEDNQFNMSARQTRLGMKFSGHDTEDVKAAGRIEFDFYGGGAENKNLLLLRHSYLTINWPKHDFTILAGQTSDVMAPMVSTTVNYTVNWWIGDIGYRRPQIRFTKGFAMGEGSRFEIQAAAARAIDGEQNGYPMAQGRASVSFPGVSGRSASLGFSGHYGEEIAEIETWSAAVDIAMPLSSSVMFKGEGWTGVNLDAFLGGIDQGLVYDYTDPLSPVPIDGVESRGGWAQLTFGPFGAWNYNVGASMDDPTDDDIVDGGRISNRLAYVNTFYDITGQVKTGFEISQISTEYKNAEDGEALRFQTAFIYSF